MQIITAFMNVLFDRTESQIGDEGAKALGEALKTNTTLTYLNLCGNTYIIATAFLLLLL